jgi:hypothetical protein
MGQPPSHTGRPGTSAVLGGAGARRGRSGRPARRGGVPVWGVLGTTRGIRAGPHADHRNRIVRGDRRTSPSDVDADTATTAATDHYLRVTTNTPSMAGPQSRGGKVGYRRRGRTHSNAAAPMGAGGSAAHSPDPQRRSSGQHQASSGHAVLPRSRWRRPGTENSRPRLCARLRLVRAPGNRGHISVAGSAATAEGLRKWRGIAAHGRGTHRAGAVHGRRVDLLRRLLGCFGHVARWLLAHPDAITGG